MTGRPVIDIDRRSLVDAVTVDAHGCQASLVFRHSPAPFLLVFSLSFGRAALFLSFHFSSAPKLAFFLSPFANLTLFNRFCPFVEQASCPLFKATSTQTVYHNSASHGKSSVARVLAPCLSHCFGL